jgi:hypothetical protein
MVMLGRAVAGLTSANVSVATAYIIDIARRRLEMSGRALHVGAGREEQLPIELTFSSDRVSSFAATVARSRSRCIVAAGAQTNRADKPPRMRYISASNTVAERLPAMGGQPPGSWMACE